METLLVVAQHRNQYHGRNSGQSLGSFGSPSGDFREINCRTFQSGTGILPTPLRDRNSPVAEPAVICSPKTPSSIPYVDQNPKQPKRITKSSSVPIPVSIMHVDLTVKENIRGSLRDEFFYSELWAGPAYSNSPPPSSLPIPKFSIKPKRTISLDLPSESIADVDLLTPVVKSAPPSPTGEHHKYSQRGFFNSHDESATKTLRRILNLDMIDG